MTFEEACRSPLGLRDYREILARFPRLILSDIPSLGRGDHDALRRLMVLVDLVYDKSHPTFVTAARDPQDLVTDPGLRTVFARTASRLQEMRFWENEI
jgi:cell division protein ZapE